MTLTLPNMLQTSNSPNDHPLSMWLLGATSDNQG